MSTQLAPAAAPLRAFSNAILPCMFPFIRYVPFHPEQSPEDASQEFYDVMQRRRSVRMFSDRPVSRTTIENIIRAAGTAPSGANKQPWRFVAVSNPDLKREIRFAAEKEEREFYARRANPTWLADLAPLGTDENKKFLEVAPWLIVVFKQMKDVRGAGDDDDDQGPAPKAQGLTSDQVYYVNESVGIAVGILLTAIHMAGLVALTHTPSPMKFLADVLRRPKHERPFLLIPIGYAAENCMVPDIQRKTLREIMEVSE
jgi:iodotyrosine deiodinase